MTTEVTAAQLWAAIRYLAANIGTATAAALAIWWFVEDRFVEELAKELQLSAFATSIEVAEIRKRVDRLDGVDKIIVQDVPASYVREPVYKGEDMAVVVRLARTETGRVCVFIEGRPVYLGSAGQRVGGPPVPKGGQFRTTFDRFVVPMAVPDSLPVGRTSVLLELQFRCGAETRFDRTVPMPFKLLSHQRNKPF